ncbi:MAG: VWA domain-containing protein, partial [Pseudomonadota bacterium]
MFNKFFLTLREAKVPCSLREYLTLLEALDKGVAMYDLEEFYYLSRAALVKDERHIDKFDQVFSHCFKGLESISAAPDEVAEQAIPEEWLRKLAEKHLSKEE